MIRRAVRNMTGDEAVPPVLDRFRQGSMQKDRKNVVSHAAAYLLARGVPFIATLPLAGMVKAIESAGRFSSVVEA